VITCHSWPSLNNKRQESTVLNEINERLSRAKDRFRRKQKLDSMLREAQAIFRQVKGNCSQHEKILAGEQADVEKLEGFSLTGLFYSILGVKEERLKTERQEYLAAKLKHEECAQAVVDTRQEIDRLSEELARYSNAEMEYVGLVKEKERFITETDDHRAEILTNLTVQLADLEADRMELCEAIEAGRTAERSLDQVRSELRSAENWGTWDLLGGGTISTWAKHSKIDSAKRQAQVAQAHLRRFQEELADADQRLHLSLGDIGGFSTFADFFFDGLIADWIVQSKVQKASSACDAAIRKVAAALGDCRKKLREVEQEIKQVENNRRECIEEA
jgi:chromosome segregation ATPase